MFAHNGEINTISRLRDEATSLGITLSRSGSDSQDVDATIRGLVLGRGLDPIEAIELLFPPIVSEIRRLDPASQDAYTRARAAFGPFAQGPAAFLARLGDLCIVGVDAMGLRPLWHVETDELQSERNCEQHGGGCTIGERQDSAQPQVWFCWQVSPMQSRFVAHSTQKCDAGSQTNMPEQSMLFPRSWFVKWRHQPPPHKHQPDRSPRPHLN